MKNVIWIVIAAIIAVGGYMLYSGRSVTEIASDVSDTATSATQSAVDATTDAAEAVTDAV